MNVIIDTNVFISGVFFSGKPYRIIKAWQAGQFALFSSGDILDEYERVIRELAPKLSSKKPKFNADKTIAFIRKEVRLAKPTLLSQQVCDDPDDDMFIACALTVRAIIVTGDKALLKTSGYKGLVVLSPAEFERQYLI